MSFRTDRLCAITAFFAVIGVFFSLQASGAGRRRPRSEPVDTGENVILVTLDGVRWQEFYGYPDVRLSPGDHGEIFNNLWETLLGEGALFGMPGTDSWVTVANPVRVSLPGYQSIMAGRAQFCFSNDCSRIGTETFPERLSRELSLPRGQVAAIASWIKIPLAFESREGALMVSAGQSPLVDPSGPDPEIARLNRLQAADPAPWVRARYDRYTWAHSIHYLRKHRPRFLFISLNDSDEWGHRADYPRYLATLRQYDRWLKDLALELASLGDYGRRTTLIVTTDHGRGATPTSWKDHGILQAASRIWMYARGPHVRPVGARVWPGHYSHAGIRPTVEKLMGLDPLSSCFGCGLPIGDIAGR